MKLSTHQYPNVPLRILHLDYEYPPIGGGGGKAHQQLLKQFTNFPDLDITLITTTDHNIAYMEEYASNVRIHFLPIRKASLHFWQRSEVMRYLWIQQQYLRHHLRDNQYSLCHVFFGFPSGWLAYQMRRRFPYIVSVRGSDVPGYNKRFGMDYIVLAPMLKKIYSRAAKVVANSNGLNQLFNKAYPNIEADIIPNGIELDEYTVNYKIQSPFKIICVARLIPRKGIDLLISACSALAQNGHHFEMHIVGEGPEQQNLETQAHVFGIFGRCKFHGRLERDEVKKLLPQCDLFVLPSYAEGMPNAALEAMASGLPLILTDTGGATELIRDNGYIIPKGSAEALEQTIEKFINSPEQCLSMGQNSRRLAEEFTWEKVAQQYYQIYLSTLGVESKT